MFPPTNSAYAPAIAIYHVISSPPTGSTQSESPPSRKSGQSSTSKYSSGPTYTSSITGSVAHAEFSRVGLLADLGMRPSTVWLRRNPYFSYVIFGDKERLQRSIGGLVENYLQARASSEYQKMENSVELGFTASFIGSNDVTHFDCTGCLL